MDTLLDDVFHIIAHYLSGEVFTFDPAHEGRLQREDGGLVAPNVRALMSMPRRRRKEWFFYKDKATKAAGPFIPHDYDQRRWGVWRAGGTRLRIALRKALRGIMYLSTCSKTLHGRIQWASVYRELVPFQRAEYFHPRDGRAIGLPSYDFFQDDQYLDGEYFYLSLVRGLGKNWGEPRAVEEMTRRMQKHVQRARGRELKEGPPRRSKRLCIEGGRDKGEEEEEDPMMD